MTPTTAAVIAASADATRGSLVSRSTIRRAEKDEHERRQERRPRRERRREHRGRQGDSADAGWFQPAMKPMNCSTITSGPGVVSASASPATDCSAVSQPRSSTRCCRHVAEHGIGAAERDQRRLREKEIQRGSRANRSRASRHRRAAGAAHKARPTESTFAALARVRVASAARGAAAGPACHAPTRDRGRGAPARSAETARAGTRARGTTPTASATCNGPRSARWPMLQQRLQHQRDDRSLEAGKHPRDRRQLP